MLSAELVLVLSRTLAALGLVAQAVMSLFAALAALSLHVDLTPALTGYQAGSDVGHSVAYSSVQRAQRVAVTVCGNIRRKRLIGRLYRQSAAANWSVPESLTLSLPLFL